MKITNKILSIILSFIILFGVVPVTAGAVEYTGKCGDNLRWISDRGLLVYGSGDMYDYEYDKSPFKSANQFSSAVIGELVTSIGEHAFMKSLDLKYVEIHSANTKIGKRAFYDCDKLREVIIEDRSLEGLPSEETSGGIIGEYAFADCELLYKVALCEGVEIIDENAFYGSYRIEKLTIPKSIKRIDHDFSNYPINITFNGTAAEWAKVVENNPKANLNVCRVKCKDKIINPSGSCGDSLVWVFDIDTGTLTISGEGEMYDYDRFYNRQSWSGYRESIKNVVIEDGVTTIGDHAFYDYDNITDITIPSSVKRIGEKFAETSAVINYDGISTEWLICRGNHSGYIVICQDKTLNPSGICGENVTWEIDLSTNRLIISGVGSMYVTYRFYYGLGGLLSYFLDNVNTVIITEGVKTIPVEMFSNMTSVEKIWIPESLSKIGYNAFDECEITDVYYMGTQEQWRNIKNRSYLTAEKIHYSCRKVEVPSTCTSLGYTTYFCDCCGVSESYAHKVYGPHNYVSSETSATCTEHGYVNKTCDICGMCYNEYTSNPTGHTFNEEGVCESCGEKEIVNNPSSSNTQLLNFESIFALIMNLLQKIFSVFTVPTV